VIVSGIAFLLGILWHLGQLFFVLAFCNYLGTSAHEFAMEFLTRNGEWVNVSFLCICPILAACWIMIAVAVKRWTPQQTIPAA
jgi:uncharacterized membrane protein YhaH (DUF805 family)